MQRRGLGGIAVSMLLFWAFFFQLSKLFLPNNLLCCAFLFVTMVLMLASFLTSIVRYRSEGQKPSLGINTVLLLAMLFFILFRNANIRNASYMSEVTYLALFVFFLFSNRAEKWVRVGFACVALFGGIHLVSSLVLQYVPGLLGADGRRLL